MGPHTSGPRVLMGPSSQGRPSPVMCLHKVPGLLGTILKEVKVAVSKVQHCQHGRAQTDRLPIRGSPQELGMQAKVHPRGMWKTWEKAGRTQDHRAAQRCKLSPSM